MWRPGLVQRDCAGLGLTVERPPSVCLPRLCLSPLSPGLYSLHVWRDNLNTSSLPSQSQYPRSVWKPVQAPFRIQPQTRLRTRATPGWLLLDRSGVVPFGLFGDFFFKLPVSTFCPTVFGLFWSWFSWGFRGIYIKTWSKRDLEELTPGLWRQEQDGLHLYLAPRDNADVYPSASR